MRRLFIVFFFILLNLQSAFAATIHGYIYDVSLNKIGNVVVEIDTIPKQFYVSKNGTYSFNVPIGYYEVRAEHYDRGILISSTVENITVKEEGEYIQDIVLFPVIDEEELLEDEIKIEPEEQNNFLMYFIVFGIVIIIILFLFYYKLSSILNRSGILNLFSYKQSNKSQEESVLEHDYALEVDDEDKTSPSIEHDNGAVDDIQSKLEVFEGPQVEDIESDEITKKIIEIIKEEGGRTTQKYIRKRIPFSEAKISLAITDLESKGKLQKIKKGRGNIIILK